MHSSLVLSRCTAALSAPHEAAIDGVKGFERERFNISVDGSIPPPGFNVFTAATLSVPREGLLPTATDYTANGSIPPPGVVRATP